MTTKATLMAVKEANQSEVGYLDREIVKECWLTPAIDSAIEYLMRFYR